MMTRGGRSKTRDDPERRCLATGESGPTERLIRFVLDPDGRVTPDLDARLPGRGVWLTADRPLVERAERKRLFARGFRRQVAVPEGLADLLETLSARRLVQLIALARKAGAAVTGFEKTKALLMTAEPGALIQASDGAADGKGKLARLAFDWPVIDVLTSRELGLAFGREFAIHAALDRGGLARRALTEAQRLAGLRPGAPAAAGTPDTVGDGQAEGGARSPSASDDRWTGPGSPGPGKESE